MNTPKLQTYIYIVSILVLALGLVSHFPSQVQASTMKTASTTGLVAYWPMNENASTSIQNNASSTFGLGYFFNDPSWANGKKGTSVQFDGVDSYISLAQCGLTKGIIGAPGATFSGWIYLDTLATTQTLAFGQINNSTGAGLAVSVNTSGNLVYQGRGSTGDSLQSVTFSTGILTGRWYHFALVIDYANDTVSSYLNGRFISSSAVTFVDTTYSTACTTAADTMGATILLAQPLLGRMDDIQLYSRTMGAFEINALYLSGQVSISQYTTDLQGYWPINDGFGSRVTDVSRNANHGTVQSTTTYSWVEGRMGKALSLGYDYVTIPSSSNLNPGTGDFTVMGWVKNNGYVSKGSIYNFLFGKRDMDSGSGYSVVLQSDHIPRFIVNSVTVTATTPINTNKWYHVAVVRSGSNSYIYVDGVLEGTSTTDPGSVTNTLDFTIAKDGDDAAVAHNRYTDGLFDEVKYYSRALTANEIARVAGAGTVTIQSSMINRVRDGLALYWSLDGRDVEWSNGTVYDRSGNANHATTSSAMSTTTSPVAGKNGQGLTFPSGLGTRLSAPPASSINITGAFTISFWIKTTNSSVSYQAILSKAGGSCVSDLRGYAIYLYDGVARLSTGSCAVTPGVSDANKSNDGNWHHVVFTHTGSAIQSWKDGVKIGSAVGTIAPANNSSSYLLVDNSSFDGQLDEIRIYNRVITDSEVASLYRSGL